MNAFNKQKRWGLLLLSCACLCSASPVMGHAVVNYAMENAAGNEVISYYIKMGITHIIPNGFDHILFIVSLCLLSTNMKTIIVTPGAVVEPVISLSIVFVAVENMVLNKLKAWRVAIVFLFGLIHGMGFASALNGVGLPRNRFFTSVLAFNAGVELGQVAVILLVFGLIIIPFGKQSYYKKKIVWPISAVIALIAAYWTIERIRAI